MKKVLLTILVIAVIGAGVAAYYMRRGGGEPTVNTLPITRGQIIDVVASTGTLQAVTTVQVGTQVSGTIEQLGADFNSIVHKGQVIARLDPSLLQAQVEQARANLVKSRADLDRNKVALDDANQKYTREKELAARNLVAQSDLDAAKVAVDSAQAQLQSSQATVSQAQASLNQAQVNLDHAVIASPIDGIVIQRSVDVGQTVAASLSSPTLFVIAADLTKMQVNATIDEADVGRIRPGQHVTFRVDAYPTDDFVGTVSQVRLQPVVVQNVTTYGTIIDVPNNDLKLKPGMTANLRVEIARRDDTLRVPNAALRFRPTPDIFAALNQPVPPEAMRTTARGGRGGRGGRTGGRSGATGPGGGAAMPAPPASAAPGGSAPATTPAGGAQAENGRRGGRGGGFDPAQMMDRFKAMTPDEQKQFVDRMKSRGQDVSAFEALMAKAAPAAKPGAAKGAAADTIDALFAPLQTVETSGTAWLYMDKQIKPVRLRLGITDGTNTEVIGNEVQADMEAVTSVTLPSTSRVSAAGGAGNPLIPQGGRRGGPPGGFGGGRGGR
jgi:HlyD family secretion protein